MIEIPASEAPFVVHKAGPRCWYVKSTAGTGELVSPTLPTKKLAQQCVDSRHEARGIIIVPDTKKASTR